MCHADGVDHVNLEGNKQIWERGTPIIVYHKFKQFHGFANVS